MFNGSRTVPTLDGDFVYTCGPLGDLYAVNINTQKVVWKKNVWKDFGGGGTVMPSRGVPPGIRGIQYGGQAGADRRRFCGRTGKRFVYVFRSQSDPARHYVGMTEDPDNRLAWHNHGPCRYTTRHRPWVLVVILEFPTERAALAFCKRAMADAREDRPRCRPTLPLPRNPVARSS